MQNKKSVGISVFSVFVFFYGLGLSLFAFIDFSKTKDLNVVRFCFILFILGILWIVSSVGLWLFKRWGRSCLLLTSFPLTFVLLFPFLFLFSKVRILVIVLVFLSPAAIAIYVLTRKKVKEQFGCANKIERPVGVIIFSLLLGLFGSACLLMASLGFILKQISSFFFIKNFLYFIIFILVAKGLLSLMRGVKNITLFLITPFFIIKYPLYLLSIYFKKLNASALVGIILSILFGLSLFYYLTRPKVKEHFK
ncbi:MAG: hypothetical protein Q8O30_04395 [Candidatus Omnitrophota bacterium]|nr:hypothetical protein [Candidatus Omnitrophota bacterium]